MTVKTVKKIEASRQQLERAIQLYFKGKDYLSPITLAGAAEEPLGKMRRQDVPSLSAVEAFANSFRHAESDPPIDREEMIGRMNEVRDWLKHFKNGSDLEFDDKECAREMITRAILNYMIAANGPTELMSKFLEFIENEA